MCDQESSSEAAFAYWAISQYGKATGDRQLDIWGSVLASTEIYASNAYFHVKQCNNEGIWVD